MRIAPNPIDLLNDSVISAGAKLGAVTNASVTKLINFSFIAILLLEVRMSDLLIFRVDFK